MMNIPLFLVILPLKTLKTRFFFEVFDKFLAKTFGGYRKKPYLCTRFKELSNTAKNKG